MVLRIVKPHSILAVYQRFGGTYCLHLHSLTEDRGNIFLFVGTQPGDYTFTLKTAVAMFAETSTVLSLRRYALPKAEGALAV
jgi:hypothetical protein